MVRFRATNSADAPTIEKFLAADPEHSKTSALSFWLPPVEEPKGAKYLAVEDEKGVIGYLVLENCLRIHAQFAPPTEIERTRVAVGETIAQIQHFSRSQYKEMLFESISRPLIIFLRKFGFRRNENQIICRL